MKPVGPPFSLPPFPFAFGLGLMTAPVAIDFLLGSRYSTHFTAVLAILGFLACNAGIVRGFMRELKYRAQQEDEARRRRL